MAIINKVLINTYNWLSQKGLLLGNSESNPLTISSSRIGLQKPLVYQRISTDGTGTGTTEMAIDGSVTPVQFYIQPPAGTIYRIARWMLYVQDGKGFDVDKWGNNITLANGLKVSVEIDGVETDILGTGVKTSGDVAGLAFDMELHTFGSGDDVLCARWTFTKAGQFVRLNGDTNDKLIVTVRDDLTNLSSQYINAQGYIE